jgi:D-glycero-alpha-D-manno-heptose 1-phosphate guanylyltransferase
MIVRNSARKDSSVTEAVILAGGKGSRLAGLVPNTQKVVAEVDGVPFLLVLIEKLLKQGIKKIILAVGYRADDVKRALLPFHEKVKLIYSNEDQPLGTGGALINASRHISTSKFLIFNGDSLIDLAIRELIEFHDKADADFSMVLCKVQDVSRYGSVSIDPQTKRILDFREKDSARSGPGLINAGVYLSSLSVLSSFPQGESSLEKDLLPALVDKKLYGYVTDMPFLDIGTPDDFVRASAFLKQAAVDS